MREDVSSSWVETLNTLYKYIEEHEQIDITQNTTRIPKEYKYEFYQLFDTVRHQYIKQYYIEELKRSGLLSKAYCSTERYLTSKLALLDRIYLPTPLFKYIHNPLIGISACLFDNLFDLIKHKIDINEFHYLSQKIIKSKINNWLQYLFNYWVMLSITKEIDVAKVYNVPIIPISSKEVIKSTEGNVNRPIPKVVPTRNISFDKETYVGFVVPDYIIYSNKIKSFLSMRFGFQRPLWKATNYKNVGKWVDFSENTPAFHPILLYTSSKLKDLALIADCQKFVKPDFLIICLTTIIDSKDANKIADNHLNFFQPPNKTTLLNWNSSRVYEDSILSQYSLLNTDLKDNRIKEMVSNIVKTINR